MSDETEKRTLIPIPVFVKQPTKTPPPFMVVGTDFIAQQESGDPLVISLRVPTKVVLQLEALSQFDQFKLVLESKGDQETLDLLLDLDAIDTGEIVRKFWQAYAEREDARLGESFTSSAS